MSASRRQPRPLEAAVIRAIGEVEGRAPGARQSWQAKLALQLARDVASSDFLSARVTAARVLAETMDRLEQQAPVEAARDPLDEIAERRARRRAG